MSDQKEKENLLKEINESSFFYGEISDELKKDIDIAKAIIKNNGSGGFDKIDPSFKSDKEILDSSDVDFTTKGFLLIIFLMSKYKL